ncbi:MAG: hypothetical protein CM15mV53_280 [uncultured marine virus]|nr:MAG: hypothetical protein CM15mV53_280 [uncultured marine virus]
MEKRILGFVSKKPSQRTKHIRWSRQTKKRENQLPKKGKFETTFKCKSKWTYEDLLCLEWNMLDDLLKDDSDFGKFKKLFLGVVISLYDDEIKGLAMLKV